MRTVVFALLCLTVIGCVHETHQSDSDRGDTNSKDKTGQREDVITRAQKEAEERRLLFNEIKQQHKNLTRRSQERSRDNNKEQKVKHGVSPNPAYFGDTQETTMDWQTTDSTTGLPGACGSNRPEVLTDYAGNFTSPFWPSYYPPNSRCEWRIISQESPQLGVFFMFTDWYLDWDACVTIQPFDSSDVTPNVDYDRTTSYSVSDGYSQTFCGYSYSNELYVSYPDVNVTFSSGYWNYGYSGFRAMYTSDNACSYNGRELSAFGSGKFTSPFYPQTYPTYLDCRWYFNYVDQVVVSFDYFDIPGSSGCNDGYLRVYSWNQGYNYYCNYNSHPYTLYLSGYVEFYFYSGSYTGHGFVARYDSQLSTMVTDQTQMETTAEMPTTQQMSVVTAPTPTECSNDRPHVLTDYAGSFTSPYWPSYYWSNLQCEWRIISQETPQQGIYFAFTDFNLYYYDCVTIEPYSPYDVSGPGGYDTTTYGVSDGGRLTFCGGSNPYRFYVSYPDVRVTFSSGWYSYGYSGFRTLYTSDNACYGNGRELQPSYSGRFTSPFYPEYYLASMDCRWYNNYAEQMVVNFNHFDIYSGSSSCSSSGNYGYLRVDSAYTGTVYYCNNRRPGTLYLYGYVEFYFHSGSYTASGFQATYSFQLQTTAPAEATTPRTTTATPPTTPEAVTTPSTTPSQAPNIQPEPYIRTTLNGTFFASDVIDTSCSDAFSSEFRSSYEDVMSRVNSAITRGQLCANTGVLKAVPGAIQLITLGNEGRVTFYVSVGLNPSEEMTIRSEEICAWDVNGFVQNFNNWRQPIISNIYGCPSVTFNPNTFTVQKTAWSCL